MSNNTERISEKEREAQTKYEEAINIFKQHPLPSETLKQGEKYAEQIEEQLKQKGWTNSQLAEKIGVSKQTITNIVQNKSSRINLQRLYAISAAFGCTPSYMVGLVKNRSEHYDKEENGKNSWDPLIPIDTAIKKFQNILHAVAYKNPRFVDFICQIVENKDIERAERLMIDAHLAKERNIERGLIPESWLAEYWAIQENEALRKRIKEQEEELEELRARLSRQIAETGRCWRITSLK